MTRRLLITYLVLAGILLASLVVPLGLTFADRQRSDLAARIERDAFTMAGIARDDVARLTPRRQREIWRIAVRYQDDTGGRVVVVDAAGRLVADSDPPQPGPRSFASRPEIAAALEGEVAGGERFSETLGEGLMVVAVPVSSGGEVLGAVRISFPTDELDADVRRFWLILFSVAAVMMAAVAVIGRFLASSVTRPLRRLRASALALGQGDLSVRVGAESGPREVGELAAGFDRMASRLEALVESQRNFAADASHQLRTPLAGLQLRLENAAHRAGPEARRDIDAALAGVERLSQIIDGLLVLARAESPDRQRVEIPLREVVEERVAAHEELAARQRVALSVAAEDHTVLGIDGALEQILDNLIDNAVKASPPGSEVAVRTALVEGAVELHVVDRGAGMSAEERAQAFDRFWRSGATGPSGSGLGLAIVRRLAEACDAGAELLDAPGGGLDAVIRLAPAGGGRPAAPEPAPA